MRRGQRRHWARQDSFVGQGAAGRACPVRDLVRGRQKRFTRNKAGDPVRERVLPGLHGGVPGHDGLGGRAMSGTCEAGQSVGAAQKGIRCSLRPWKRRRASFGGTEGQGARDTPGTRPDRFNQNERSAGFVPRAGAQERRYVRSRSSFFSSAIVQCANDRRAGRRRLEQRDAAFGQKCAPSHVVLRRPAWRRCPPRIAGLSSGPGNHGILCGRTSIAAAAMRRGRHR